jgi:hypothetical protein
MTDHYLRAVAERELRDAVVRYLARIRHREAPIDTVCAAWEGACRYEMEMIGLVRRGTSQYGSMSALAAAEGYNPTEIGRRGAAEIERVARTMELVDERTQDDD